MSLLKSIQRMIDSWQSKQVLGFVTSFLDEDHACTKKFLFQMKDDFSIIEDLCLKILVDLTVYEKITETLVARFELNKKLSKYLNDETKQKVALIIYSNLVVSSTHE